MARNARWRVRSLLYLLAAGILLPMALLQAYLIGDQHTQDQRQAESEALRLAQLTADTTETFISDTRDLLQTLASRPLMRAKASGTTQHCDPIFSTFKEFYPQLSNMSLSTPAGFLACSALPQPDGRPLPVAHMAWFKQVYARQQFVVGPIVYGPINKNWISVLAQPVRDGGGNMVGALQTPIDLQRFRVIPAAEKLPAPIDIVIFDSQGTVLARSRDAARYIGTRPFEGSEILSLALNQGQGTVKTSSLEGVTRLYGFAPVPGTDWTVLAGINADHAFAAARQNALTSALVGAALVAVVLSLALLVSRRIAGPMWAVHEAAKQIGSGRHGLRVPTDGPLEVAEVAGQLNVMLDAIGRTRSALQDREQRLKLALEGAEMAIWDLDVAAGSIYLSDVWSVLVGEPRHSIQAPVAEVLRQVARQDRPTLRAALRAVLRHGNDEFKAEYRIIRRDGHEVWLSTTAHVTERDAQGRATRLLGVIVDITERKLREAEIHKLAYFDPLTGLPNRRLLWQQLAQAVARTRRNGLAGALMFIDLDRFKSINDARGHAIGDALLTSVATRLQSLVRDCDVVARMGGDEFVVVAADLSEQQSDAARQAHLLAEKIRHALEQPYHLEKQGFTSSASIGVVLFERNSENCDDLLRQADTAMYKAKAAGRNQIAFFCAEMQVEVENRLTLENELARALDRRQLGIYVQPQVNPAGDTVGAELLLRWQHPLHGNVPPAQFIPLAEDTGMIVRMGDWVMDQACELLTELQARGLDMPLSVNVSPRQFRQANFVSNVRARLERHGTPPHRLIFEVTESLLLDQADQAIGQMHELAALGVRFSIDDFGTGYSSLSYLKRLPLHELKIDKTFVDGTPDEPQNAEIVQLVISLAKMLGLRVVAEGVETPVQASFLRDRGCDVLQGFLYAKPRPVRDWLSTLPATAQGTRQAAH